MTKLRIVFIGQNGEITTRPLEAVGEAHSLVGIIESAPRWSKAVESGPSPNPIRRRLGQLRRQLVPPPPPYKSVLQRVSERRQVPFRLLTKNSFDTLHSLLNDARPDVICVSSMSQLLPESTFKLARLGAINLHPAALPKYRGPNPWFWQYYHLEKAAGVTIHVIDRGEDTGDILRQELFPIELGLPFPLLSARAIEIGSRLMVETLNDLAAGLERRQPQPATTGLPRARNIKRDERLIDWDAWPLERVWHVMRGTGDWLDAVQPPGGPGSRLRWTVGDMVREPANAPPGTVSRDRDGYFASHRDGKIRLGVDASGSSRLRYYRFTIAGW